MVLPLPSGCASVSSKARRCWRLWKPGCSISVATCRARPRPIDYMLKRRDRFAPLIDDSRVCLTNNAAERASPALRLLSHCAPPC
jgi:hypothetical protein